MPTTSCVPYVPDTSCDENWDTYDQDLKDRAVVLAWAAIRTMTGGMVGNCPVILRPCLQSASPCSRCFTAGTWGEPHIDSIADWTSLYPRCSCSCEQMCEILMPGQVAEITKITQDAETIPPTDYRLDNAIRLVRTDGLCWPACQDMAAAPGEPNTVAITYVPGIKPDAGGLWAAGIMASEFVKACGPGKCRLPAKVTSVARQGVSMTFSESYFENGTGIREVDAYVFSVNPNKLRRPPTVWSPDLPEHRITPVPAP